MAIINTLIENASAPYLNLKTNQRQRSSDGEKVTDIESMHGKWVEADRPNRTRLFDSLETFYDIDGSAWPEQERNQVIAEGRHPVSINIAAQKLYSLAGHIRSEKWDYDFLSMDLENNSLLKNIKWWYYADKEQYNYEQTESITLLRGLIHGADEEMEIRYDVRPTGAINFIPCQPGSIIKDPYWQTNDHKDWRRAMKDAWLRAQNIKDIYEVDNAMLDLYAQTHGIGTETYETLDDLRTFEDVPSEWGSKLLVTEYRWLERYKTTRLYMYLPNGEILPLPLKIEESEVRDLMARFGVDNYESIKEYPYVDDILYLCTICPQIAEDLILYEGKHNIQCGSIGFFHFSAAREMGMDKGTMEAVMDLQRLLNYRESKKDDIIAAGAAGGLVVDRSKLGNNPDEQLKRLKENRTRPDLVLDVDGPVKEAIGLIPTAEVPQSIWSDLITLVDMFDRVIPVTPALEGRGGKEESGILFEMRHAVAKLGTLILYDNWNQHLMNKAEAWYNQARITYKGLYRKIANKESNTPIEFNSPVFKNGRKGYLNSLEQLPSRAQVIVTLSKSSPTEQFATRTLLYDVVKILSGHGELFPEEIRILIYKFLNSSEMTLEEKADLLHVAQLKKMRDVISIISQIKQLEAQGLNADVLKKQAQGMLNQLSAPQGPQGAQGLGSPNQGEGGGTEQAIQFEDEGIPEEMSGPAQGEMTPGQPVETIRGTFQP
jgi:hypothetical protein